MDAGQGRSKYRRHVNFSKAVHLCCAFPAQAGGNLCAMLAKRTGFLPPGQVCSKGKNCGQLSFFSRTTHPSKPLIYGLFHWSPSAALSCALAATQDDCAGTHTPSKRGNGK